MPTKAKKIVKEKKIVGSSREDKMMVLLEDMRDGIHLVAEGHSVLDRKVDSLRTEVKEEIGELRLEMNVGFNSLRLEMNGMVGGLRSEMNENFKLAMENLSSIEDEIMEIKSELKELKREFKNKVELKRIIVLEERVKKLEMRQLVLRDAAKKKYKV